MDSVTCPLTDKALPGARFSTYLDNKEARSDTVPVLILKFIVLLYAWQSFCLSLEWKQNSGPVKLTGLSRNKYTVERANANSQDKMVRLSGSSSSQIVNDWKKWVKGNRILFELPGDPSKRIRVSGFPLHFNRTLYKLLSKCAFELIYTRIYRPEGVHLFVNRCVSF